MSKPKRTIKIIGERDIELNLSNPAHHERIASIGKALSSPIRLQILALLKDCAMSVQEIAHILNIPVSSTAVHIRCLEDAQLIITEVQPGNHGSMRVCICSMQTFTLSTVNPELSAVDNSVSIEMPIGHYFQCKIEPTCGLADENGAIDMYDSPSSSILRTEPKHSSFGFTGLC
ncbi:MAG: ArsR/SmtB family transcription factor [Waltera sp.]